MPFSAASAERLRASANVAPSAIAALNASRPGTRASIMVLSSGSALPRAWTPPTAASSAAAQSSGPLIRACPEGLSIAATPAVASLCRPSQPGRLHRRIPEAGQLVVQLQQGDRAPCHLQGCDVRPDQVARDRDPALAEEPVQVVVDDVQLEQRRAAHAVDEGEHLVAVLKRQVLDDRGGEPLDDLLGGGGRGPPAAPPPRGCPAPSPF